MNTHRSMKRWLALPAACLLGFAPALEFDAHAPAVATPAELVALHEKLFAALDGGDAAAVQRMVAPAAVLWVVDHRGQPVALQGDNLGQQLVDVWQSEREDQNAATEITTRGTVGDVTLLELERTGLDPDLFRCTSVVTRVAAKDAGAGAEAKEGEAKEGAEPKSEGGPPASLLSIAHLHIAPAVRRDYR